MPSVPSRALLVYDHSLLRVCPPGGTLCNNIIGVADIACGHNQPPFAQGEKWIHNPLFEPRIMAPRELQEV
jgi:hypothetical protein